MLVEPASLCWLAGRQVAARDGVTWAGEFRRWPALRAVVRDGGTGLSKGVALEPSTGFVFETDLEHLPH